MLAENGTSPSSLIWRFFLGATGGMKREDLCVKITQQGVPKQQPDPFEQGDFHL